MIYFNMDGALGAPKAIMADGNIVAITTDIALAVAQVYHNFTDPITKMLFKKGMEKVFASDSPIWETDTKADADFVQCVRYDAKALMRQAEDLNRE